MIRALIPYNAGMDYFLQACLSKEIAPDSQWIRLLPVGPVTCHDGRKFTLKNPEAVIAASIRPSVDLVVDREHGMDKLPGGTAVPAAGWMKEFKIIDGWICARTDWTPRARQELADKEYRYISPTFIVNKKTGEIIRITSATLTNDPALEYTAVASRNRFSPSNNEESPDMDKYLLSIATLLGLGATADGDAIVTAAKKRFENETALTTELASVRKALGADDKATAETLVTLASTLKSDKTDPSKFVPLKDFEELKETMASMKKKAADADAEAAAMEAVKAGKVTPAMKDWAVQYASRDPEGFRDYVAKTPVIAGGSQETARKTGGGSAAGVSEEDLMLCRQLGIKPEDLDEKDAA